jgi:Tfp pilus assembly protein PilF
VLAMADRLSEAIDLRRLAIAHYDGTSFKAHPAVVDARLGLGLDLLRAGRVAEARATLQEALAMSETITVPATVVASVRAALATIKARDRRRSVR